MFLETPDNSNDKPMHNLKSRLAAYRLLPVVTPVTVAGAVELAGALRAGGIRAIEITLRTDVALDALIAVKEAGIDIEVGAGTVTTVERAEKVAAIGVQFAVTPGVTPALLQAAQELGLPLLPGVSGPSDIMLGIEYGREVFKLFPAAAVGGEALLKTLAGPFPEVSFCPTGGIGPANAGDYLALPNVICIGGSWMAPADLVQAENWQAITKLSRQAVALLSGH